MFSLVALSDQQAKDLGATCPAKPLVGTIVSQHGNDTSKHRALCDVTRTGPL